MDRNGTQTEIEEPVGWDANACNINRDNNWHGIFFDNSGNNLEYYGDAMRLLKAEYQAYGAKGDMTLIVEELCADGNVTNILTEAEEPILTEQNENIITEDSILNDLYVEFIRAKFVFIQYSFVCTNNSCYIKIPIESSDEIMNLRNQIDQKVDLESLVALDQTTILAPYTKLPFSLQLPSKGIFIENNAEVDGISAEDFDGPTTQLLNEGDPTQIEFGLPDNQLSEIGSFAVYDTHLMDNTAQLGNWFSHLPPTAVHGNGLWPLNLNPIENYYNGSSNYNAIVNPVRFDIRLKGNLNIKECYLGETCIYLMRLPADKTGEIDTDYEYLAQDVLYNIGNPDLDGMLPPNYGALPFDFSFLSDVTINKGDRFYCFMGLNIRKTNTEMAAVTAGASALSLTLDSGSYIKMTNLSKTAPTPAYVFGVNEVISRISESITNDKLRAYSEYFGRTDSQPYALPADGCGGMEVITDGLRIRQQQARIPGQSSVLSISLKDVFDGLNPIHNIGMGVETDINRSGYNRLRVEPWKYFYNDVLVMSCIGINKLQTDAQQKEIYSTFQFGYNKWEAQQYNGLDEFLTKREYRTTINSVKNALAQLSTFIGSGYALEVTRRENNNSKDWKYDNDVFVICVKRGGTQQLLVTFVATNTIKVVCLGNNYAHAESIFYVGAAVVVTGVKNSGTYHVTATSEITNYLVVTITETVVDETTTISVPDPNGLSVELGNIETPSNIIDPDSVYNFRISPTRNAMRWMNMILKSYAKFDIDSKIIFTSGDGNYFAKGKMLSTDCRLENQAIEENQTLDEGIFLNIADAAPFLRPERIKYDFPMNTKDYKAIKANPGGTIYFESDCESGYGWIDTIVWKPASGLATFTLIPKY